MPVISIHPTLDTKLIPPTSHNRDLILRPHSTTDQRSLSLHTRGLLPITTTIKINLAVMISITPIHTNSNSSKAMVTIPPVTLIPIPAATLGPTTKSPTLQLIRAAGSVPTLSTLLLKLRTSPLSHTQFSPFANSSLVLQALALSSLLSSPKDRSSFALCSAPLMLAS